MGRPGRDLLRVAALAVVALSGIVPLFPAQQGETLLEMVHVRGGTFLMGDGFGHGRSDEKPLHSVTVGDFTLSRFEVTVGQFRRFVQETGYRTSAERQGGWLVWTGMIWERKFNASWRRPEPSVHFTNPSTCVRWPP